MSAAQLVTPEPEVAPPRVNEELVVMMLLTVVRAAWLKFPSFELEPLSQVYLRIDASTYMYESGGGQFTVDLKVDPFGFVTNYPEIVHS